ncbi:protein kinase type I-beta regulatory subunit [Seminavis robusta]|uniref:Protein kinase type I-beta regulatory subunit n=1 Tax=Seminavis robusta TaxID=568900 RepID=A0A9N8EPE8_9STRA|nr:protein kinase type I-beta regulatory subunit [Seminavis robusta]|eukprot:Sro1593_g284560.1 protein kinase type I-beta regulatory subunit (686) ;mRNA; f:20991-23202
MTGQSERISTIPSTSMMFCLGIQRLQRVALLVALACQGATAFAPQILKTATASIGHSAAASVSNQYNRWDTRLRVSSTEEISTDTELDLEALRGPDGIYNIEDKTQHKAFLKENSDQLVILKVFAPWCRACKGLEPKYQQIAKDKTYADVPIKFTSMSIQNNKDYIKSIGVLALPTVQFYKNGQLVDNFPCGPSKLPILKRKLADLVGNSVDPDTNRVKPPRSAGTAVDAANQVVKPPGTPSVPVKKEKQQLQLKDGTPSPEHKYLTKEQIEYMRTKVPFFETLEDDDWQSSLEHAKILTFDSGSIIMKEGNLGHTFYVILEGEVEICQRTAFEDPLIAPTDYIGTVINRLGEGDWFGERALITGEARAASIRVTDPMRCVAFCQEDLPASCVLRGLPQGFAPSNSTVENAATQKQTEIVDRVNEKYGLSMKELDAIETSRIVAEATLENQKRGSANTPEVIRGVDTDDDDDVDVETPNNEWNYLEDASLAMLKSKTASIVPLLEKFKLIQLIARCFDYIVDNRAKWGDPAIRRRRALLVSRLPRSQREEFVEAFRLVDASGDGGISMMELRRVMDSIGEEKSDEELWEMIPHGYQSGSVGEDVMTLEDFMGIMAEAEFYHLFRDIFASLDKRESGFVKAKDLDRVLCGVRDLISDDRHSIIDMEDKEMMIDYEQFTKSLIGLSL